MKILGADSAESVAIEATKLFESLAVDAVNRRGRFVWAVSGGSTPRLFLDRLALSERVDWSKVHLFQVDERVAADGTETRNDTAIRSRLTDLVPIGAYTPMPVVHQDLHNWAIQYQTAVEEVAGVPAVLDLVQLGLGADGHTASLVPGDAVLSASDRDIDITSVYGGARRMTMTYPILNRARHRMWIVAGAAKRSVLTQTIGRNAALPASRITTSQTTIITDVFRGKHASRRSAGST